MSGYNFKQYMAHEILDVVQKLQQHMKCPYCSTSIAKNFKEFASFLNNALHASVEVDVCRR